VSDCKLEKVRVSRNNYIFRVYTTEYQEKFISGMGLIVSDKHTSIIWRFMVWSAAPWRLLLSRNRKCVKMLKVKQFDLFQCVACSGQWHRQQQFIEPQQSTFTSMHTFNTAT